MANNTTTVHVRKKRNHIVVLAMSQTNRGQKYIRKHTRLEVSSMSDPKFKEELAAEVEKLLA